MKSATPTGMISMAVDWRFIMRLSLCRTFAPIHSFYEDSLRDVSIYNLKPEYLEDLWIHEN